MSVAPFGSLFASGDLSLLESASIAVAGSRKIDSRSSAWLADILSQCGSRTIVSGLALGADAVAHRTALKLGVPTIAVLPSGINNIAPRSHTKLAAEIVDSGGLLLSAYAPNSGARRHTFVERNKIIAHLGDLLIVPQCARHSGTMHTVDFARALNKPVVVQNANYSGNQFILSDYSAAIPK